MAIATEEQAIRKIFADEVEVVNYDGPLQSTCLASARRSVPA